MKEIAELDLPGYAIGGLAVGESAEEMYETISVVEEHMPKDKTRYLMGVGTPANILQAVSRGVDLFDCVMPARNGRHGHLFTWQGIMNIQNAKHADSDAPVDVGCDCPVCRKYSRAYLHHLFKAGEMLALRFAVLHNLYFYNSLMSAIRRAIENDEFSSFYSSHIDVLTRRC
jgi:queuine tRNA-ribosyltransferase